MFDEIVPPEKGPATWLSRDAKKVLVQVFNGLGEGLLGIGGVIFLFTPVRYFMPMAICISAVIIGCVFTAIAEYFRDEYGI